MSTELTMTKLGTPTEVNGRIARYELVTEQTEEDTATSTDVVLHSSTSPQWDETKQSLLRRWREEKRQLVIDRQIYIADSAERLAQVNDVIAQLEAS